MATIEEMLNKKGSQRKPFKKISYKPWESSFISKTDVSLSDDEIQIEDELLNKEGRGQEAELSSGIKKIDFLVEQKQGEGPEQACVERESDNVSIKTNDIADKMSMKVNDSVVADEVLETNPNFSDSIKEGFSSTISDVNLESIVSSEIIDLPLSASEVLDVSTLAISSIVPQKRVVFRLQSIIGICRLILFDLIKREEDRDDNFIYCSAVTTSELALIHNTTYRVMATTINRLKTRGYLFAIDGKRGKGGYSVYSVPLFVVKEIEKWNEQQKYN